MSASVRAFSHFGDPRSWPSWAVEEDVAACLSASLVAEPALLCPPLPDTFQVGATEPVPGAYLGDGVPKWYATGEQKR